MRRMDPKMERMLWRSQMWEAVMIVTLPLLLRLSIECFLGSAYWAPGYLLVLVASLAGPAILIHRAIGKAGGAPSRDQGLIAIAIPLLTLAYIGLDLLSSL